MARIQRALISVFDKTGLIPFAQTLVAAKVELLSTGGTARVLRDAGLPLQAGRARVRPHLGLRCRDRHPSDQGFWRRSARAGWARSTLFAAGENRGGAADDVDSGNPAGAAVALRREPTPARRAVWTIRPLLPATARQGTVLQ